VTCSSGEQSSVIFSRNCRDIAVVVHVIRRKELQRAEVDHPINRATRVRVDPIRPLLALVAVAITVVAPAAL
jgi:hypothetical protein